MERRTPRNYKVRSTNGTRFFMRGYTDTAIELANTLNVTMYNRKGEASGGDIVAYIRVPDATITVSVN